MPDNHSITNMLSHKCQEITFNSYSSTPLKIRSNFKVSCNWFVCLRIYITLTLLLLYHDVEAEYTQVSEIVVVRLGFEPLTPSSTSQEHNHYTTPVPFGPLQFKLHVPWFDCDKSMSILNSLQHKLESIAVGDVLAAPFDMDKSWYRAKVMLLWGIMSL